MNQVVEYVKANKKGLLIKGAILAGVVTVIVVAKTLLTGEANFEEEAGFVADNIEELL
jgi:hypothetical protein